jgi:hypothetical protein
VSVFKNIGESKIMYLALAMNIVEIIAIYW